MRRNRFLGAVPLSALTACQALFDYGRLAAGQKVLIHGATGGVGTFASPVGKTDTLSGPLPPQISRLSANSAQARRSITRQCALKMWLRAESSSSLGDGLDNFALEQKLGF
jgi:hypothetical protein